MKVSKPEISFYPIDFEKILTLQRSTSKTLKQFYEMRLNLTLAGR